MAQEYGAAYASGKPIIVFDPYANLGKYHFMKLRGLAIVNNLDDLEEEFIAEVEKRV